MKYKLLFSTILHHYVEMKHNFILLDDLVRGGAQFLIYFPPLVNIQVSS